MRYRLIPTLNPNQTALTVEVNAVTDSERTVSAVVHICAEEVVNKAIRAAAARVIATVIRHR
jgi:hypothetical protein